jgi:gliding motility-associated-like protein
VHAKTPDFGIIKTYPKTMKLLKLSYCLFFAVFHISAFTVLGIEAKFSFIQRSNCSPTYVEFTNTSSSGTGINYKWDFGLGAVVTTSDNSSKTQLYTTPGKYTVTLIAYDAIHSDTASAVITIAEGPVANFRVNPLYGCPPLLVTYTSTSTPGSSDIVSTEWDFRDGNYFTGTVAQHTYLYTGKFGVILKVTDKNGCYRVMESDSIITVADKPVVNFSASDTFACNPPLNTTFINKSTGSTGLTYLWNYGNGKTSTELSNSTVYSASGNYDVTLKATDQYGCTASLVKEQYIRIGNPTGTISVYNAAHSLVSKPVLCPGTYHFVFSVKGLPDYIWKIDDNGKTSIIQGQDSIAYQISDAGTLNITLTYGKSSFCTDSITLIYEKSDVSAGFSLDKTLFCSVPQQVNLTNESKNASQYAWYFSDELFSNSNAVSYTITKESIPVLTYQQLYSRKVNTVALPFTLVATNSDGCTDSVTHEVTISFPFARFMPDKVSGCAPLQVSFSDSSKSAYTIDEYQYWSGTTLVTSTINTPISYTFTNPGTYYISEIIKSKTCYDTSEVVKVEVGEKLIPDFTVSPSTICNGGQIHIVANSNNNAAVDSWQLISDSIFNFSSASRPDTLMTVYSETMGNKNIGLQVDYNGCLSDITKQNIFNIAGPVGTFKTSFSCDSSLAYHFKSGVSPATSLDWHVDTATFSNVDSIRYKFPKSGDYPVTLVAADHSSGCSLTVSKVIKVRDIQAAFTFNDSILCAGDSLKLDASSSSDYISTCYVEGFLWNFGDDSPPRRTFSTTYSHIYNSKGKYKLLFVATADNGCVDSIRKNIYVFKPQGIFTVDKDTGCLKELAVNFKNTSTDSTVLSWTWTFGDGVTDTTNTKTVLHTYSTDIAQTYTSSLTVYDAYNCYGNYSLPITLIGVNTDFQADDNAICAGESVTFTPIDTTIENVSWTFGDGSAATTVNTCTYKLKGLYSVSLAASKNGCSDTITKTNYISVEKADAGFTVSDSVFYCYPDTVLFIHSNVAGSAVVDRTWKFDANVLSSGADSVKYAYTKPGSYKASLTVKTLNGCEASSSRTIQVSGPFARYSFSPQKVCYNELVNFKIDSMSNVSGWEWLFGDGSSSSANPASHKYTSRGGIVPSLTLTSHNCSVTYILDSLMVSQVTADFYREGNSLNVCYGDSLNLINTSTNSQSWLWEINNNTLSTDFNLNQAPFSKTGNYNISLIATGADNCTDTMTKTYTVVSLPVFSINGDSILCKNQSSIVLSVDKNSGTIISWTPATSVSDPSAFTTEVHPTSTTTYIAKVTDANGCSSTREKTIAYNQPLTYSRIPLGDTTISLGEKIQLIVKIDSGSVAYSWSPNDKISCLTCSNPYVSPISDATYIVKVTSVCYDFTETFIIYVLHDFYLEAPTAFTPNGDMNNDVFKFDAQNIQSIDLKIFNRWGQIVYSTKNVSEGWDGKVNGKLQNIDTYTYWVKAETIHGYKFEKKGSFLLLK